MPSAVDSDLVLLSQCAQVTGPRKLLIVFRFGTPQRGQTKPDDNQNKKLNLIIETDTVPSAKLHSESSILSGDYCNKWEHLTATNDCID